MKMHKLFVAAIVSIIIYPALAQLKPEAWKKTDKDCAFYHPYSSTQNIFASWSGICNAKGNIEGLGTLFISRKNKEEKLYPFIKFTGNYTDGVLNGKAEAFLFIKNLNNYRLYYAGEYKNGLRHGKGKYYYYDNESANENAYEGNWIEGKREGKGRYFVTATEYFDCNWVNDEPVGNMVYRFQSGEYYEGGQKNGVWEGQGSYFFTDGSKFEGLWKNGDLVIGKKYDATGNVLEIIDESDIYQFASLEEEKDIVAEQATDRSIFTRLLKGEKKRDEASEFLGTDAPLEKPNEYTKENLLEQQLEREKEKIKSEVAINEGVVYQSERNNAEVWLPTKPVSANSANWVGKVAGGKGHGPGMLILYRVNEFDLDKPIPIYKIEGNLFNGKFKGDAKEYKLNEETKNFDLVFEGAYQDGYRSGEGTWYTNEQVVTGTFFYNKIVGPAYYAYANGDSFEGVIINGKKEGKGVYTKANGSITTGEWNGDKLSGFSTINLPDGSRYRGNILYDKYHGQGTLFKSAGGRLEGNWVSGQLQNGVETNERGKTILKYKNGKTIKPGRGWRTVGTIFAVAATVAVTAVAVDYSLNAVPSPSSNKSAVNKSTANTKTTTKASTSGTTTSSAPKKPTCRFYVHFSKGSNDTFFYSSVMKFKSNCGATFPQGKFFDSFEEAQSFINAKVIDAENDGYESKLKTVNNPCPCK